MQGERVVSARCPSCSAAVPLDEAALEDKRGVCPACGGFDLRLELLVRPAERMVVGTAPSGGTVSAVRTREGDLVVAVRPPRMVVVLELTAPLVMAPMFFRLHRGWWLAAIAAGAAALAVIAADLRWRLAGRCELRFSPGRLEVHTVRGLGQVQHIDPAQVSAVEVVGESRGRAVQLVIAGRDPLLLEAGELSHAEVRWLLDTLEAGLAEARR